MHVAEFDRAVAVIQRTAFLGPCIDNGSAIEEFSKLVRRILGFAHVGRETEYRASRLGAEENLAEADEELEGCVFVFAEEGAAVPETQRDAEEDERLRRGVEQGRLEDGD
jgi:hypothetical protein